MIGTPTFPTDGLKQSTTPATSVLNLGVKVDDKKQFQSTHIEQMSLLFLPYPRSSLYSLVYLTFRNQTHCNSFSKQSRRPDYCNYLPYNTANKDIAKLQSIQNPLVFSLSVAAEFIALAPCALSHYFQGLYKNLSSPLINTTTYLNSMLTPARYSRQL